MSVAAVSVVAATFGIQNAMPWPAATYACWPTRTSARATAASRAWRSNARTAARASASLFFGMEDEEGRGDDRSEGRCTD